MEKKKKKVWQESAGDTKRDYVDVCLDNQVILNGPGRFGHWPDCKDALIDYGKRSGVSKTKKAKDLRRFAEDMKEGDIVLLRTGTNLIHAIGIISGKYTWNELFSDVDGWDLQHVRRVKWVWDKSKIGGEPKKFPIHSLKRGDTTQLLGDLPYRKPVEEWVKSLKLNYDVSMKVRDLPKISKEEKKEVTLDQIGEFLFSKGVSSYSIESLKNSIDDLQMIARWYDNDSYLKPTEFETEAYLIIPILRKLGWTPQKMALEYKSEKEKGKRIDIALFSNLPRSTENIVALIEAKRKGDSVFHAFQQAEDYAKGNPAINRLIVTDGIRYGVYLKSGEKWTLHAYMNLTRFKKRYKIYDCLGILEVLWVMSPEWTKG